MLPFINPWIWNILNDDMPSLYTGVPKEDRKVIWVMLYWLVLSVVYCAAEILVMRFKLCSSVVACLVGFVSYFALLIFGLNKILK